MRKYLPALALFSLFSLAAGPATAPTSVTPWQLLVQAGELPAADSPRSSSMEYAPYPPYSKEWWSMAWESEQQNGETFSMLHESRLLMQRNGQHAGSPTPTINDSSIKQLLGPLNPMRNMANLVSDAALFSHLNGNDTEATARILDGWNIAACVRQSHVIICQLVGVGIEALSCANICIIAPTLHVTDIPANVNTRKQTVALIALLLDEQPDHESWLASFAWELHSAEHPYPGIKGFAAQAVSLTAAEVDHDLLLLNQACEFRNLPASLALEKQCQFPKPWQFLDRVFITEFRVVAERRMCAINLAVELYRADHNGSWPKTLDKLVPHYLPSVPRDPFRADDASVGYEIIPHGWPDAQDRPVLFCDAGPDIHLNKEPRLAWYSENKKDARQYRDLTLPASISP